MGWIAALFLIYAATTSGSELEVLARHTVAGEPSSPVDVRWADGDSVYLVRAYDGVWQVALDGAATPRRQWLPTTAMLGSAMGDQPYTRLAATADHIAVLRLGWQIAWRRAQSRPDRSFEVEKEPFARPIDLDAQAGRIVVLGARDGDPANERPALWIGSLARDLDDLHPLGGETGATPIRDGNALASCWPFGLGALRWLDGGRLLVVPGFAPGAYLLSSSGRLLRSWSDDETGTGTAAACAALSGEDKHRMLADAAELRRWRNELAVVDEVLPMPSGPAVLIRSVDATTGLPRWRLRRLGDPADLDVPVPIEARGPDDRLRGDVLGDRILLLRFAARPAAFETRSDGELFILRAASPSEG